MTLRRFDHPPQELALDQQALQVIRQGLYDATHAPEGTSSPIFGHFPEAIAGKTGTSEREIHFDGFSRLMDTSWWCGFGPFDSPEIVVCAVIENGGFGGEAAAPAALRVFEAYFGKEAGLVQPADTD
jgi:penicillin-binding protein 2